MTKCRPRSEKSPINYCAEFTTIGYLPDDDSARGQEQPVATIAAPVFDHRQRVAMIVAVHPLCPLTRRRVIEIGKRLTRETAEITKAQQQRQIG